MTDTTITAPRADTAAGEPETDPEADAAQDDHDPEAALAEADVLVYVLRGAEWVTVPLASTDAAFEVTDETGRPVVYVEPLPGPDTEADAETEADTDEDE